MKTSFVTDSDNFGLKCYAECDYQPLDYYHPPTKLLEGNVFSHVCLSFCSHRGPHVTITHDALDLSVQSPLGLPPSPGHGDPPKFQPPKPAPPNMGHGDPLTPAPLIVTSGGHHWRPVQTYSLDLTVQPPPPVLTDI